ncbi:hypothetical protein GCM10027449_29160 [Sinomonas notoginsengisoli]
MDRVDRTALGNRAGCRDETLGEHLTAEDPVPWLALAGTDKDVLVGAGAAEIVEVEERQEGSGGPRGADG